MLNDDVSPAYSTHRPGAQLVAIAFSSTDTLPVRPGNTGAARKTDGVS